MGIYYYLLNDSKSKLLHLDNHVKHGPVTINDAVHCAFVNYMFEHQGDSFRLLSDMHWLEEMGYEEINLLKYKFADPCVTEKIVSILNDIYGDDRYYIKEDIGYCKPDEEELIKKQKIKDLHERNLKRMGI